MTGYPALFFSLFSGLAILFSLMVVFKKNPVSSAFSLLMVFFCFAGIYAVQDAHLIAALQVLVYAGAIVVLFVFVIMLLNVDGPSFDRERTTLVRQGLAGALCLIVFFILAHVFMKSPTTGASGPFTSRAIEAMGGNTQVLSEVLFSEGVLPFELTSILLLAAVVGAVSMSKRKLKLKEESRQ